MTLSPLFRISVSATKVTWIRLQPLLLALFFTPGLTDFRFTAIKTNNVAEFIKRFEIKKVLILIENDNEILEKSARNLRNAKVIRVEGLNVYDLLRFQSIVFTESSLLKVQEAYKN
jgi:large subunit ribosomal protein L4